MKNKLIGIIAGIAIVLIGFGTAAVASAHRTEKVTLCHETESTTNPWIVQVVNANEVQSHLDNGDFLYTGSFGIHTEAARDWCNEQITPTPTATPDPTDEVSPTPQCEGEGCVSTPTPTPSEEITPTPTDQPAGGQGGGSTASTPVCEDGNTLTLVANPHVVRHGTSADVNFFITQGDGANIYYKEVGVSDWNHSVVKDEVNKYKNSENFVSYPVGGLDANVGYVFAVQQTNGCGGGKLADAVIVDGPVNVTFPVTFWEWSK